MLYCFWELSLGSSQPRSNAAPLSQMPRDVSLPACCTEPARQAADCPSPFVPGCICLVGAYSMQQLPLPLLSTPCLLKALTVSNSQEVHTGTPSYLIAVPHAIRLTCFQIALAVGDDQLRPDVPAGTPPDLTNLALSCFDGDPLGRPSFSLIVSQLSNVISKLDSRSSQQQGGADGTFSRLIRGRPTSLWNTFSAQKT